MIFKKEFHIDIKDNIELFIYHIVQLLSDHKNRIYKIKQWNYLQLFSPNKCSEVNLQKYLIQKTKLVVIAS